MAPKVSAAAGGAGPLEGRLFQERAMAIVQAMADRSPINSAEYCDYCRRTVGHDPQDHARSCAWRRAWVLIWAVAKRSANPKARPEGHHGA